MPTPRPPRTQPRILIIADDNPARGAIIAALRAANLDVLTAADGTRGLALFQETLPDLVIVDEELSHVDGFQVTTALRGLADGWSSPILFLMGSRDEVTTRRALEAGVTDFAPKPIDAGLLARHVPFLLRLGSAYKDAVTGLPTQALFLKRLESALSHSGRRNRKVAVMVLDLRDFRQFNDSLGHNVGDAMLSEVAERLRTIVRLQDEVSRAHQSGGSSSVARWGGDEFLLAVIDLASGKDAASVAARILDTFKAPIRFSGRAFHLSGSIGISLFPDDSKDPVELLHLAALALHQTTGSGRNHFAFFSPSMNDQARARFGLEADLHRALEANEITVHYQPIVESASGRVVGVEALARWLHPRIGAVSPDRFIAAAERLGLIDELSRQLIRLTSEHVRSWREKGLPSIYVSINISGRQFRDPNLAKVLASAAKRAGVGPSDILLEVTESVLIDDLNEGERILGKLKELGFRIAIDDFGTGYSSLSYVKRFPVDVLKIDREFIRDIALDERDRVMATGVLFLAQGLGVEAVAEGVETEAQRNLLLACSCPLMQGYLFAKPMPADELSALLARTGGVLVPEFAPNAESDRRRGGDPAPPAASEAAGQHRVLEQKRRQSLRPAIRRSA